MNEIQEKFLEALRVSLKNGTVWWEEPLQPGQWRELFGLAETHHVLPLIYEAVYRSPAAGQADPRLMENSSADFSAGTEDREFPVSDGKPEQTGSLSGYCERDYLQKPVPETGLPYIRR